jgi:hypothetical protein
MKKIATEKSITTPVRSSSSKQRYLAPAHLTGEIEICAFSWAAWVTQLSLTPSGGANCRRAVAGRLDFLCQVALVLVKQSMVNLPTVPERKQLILPK